MQINQWREVLAGSLKNTELVLTIGVFDGLHLGHQELIKRVLLAPESGDRAMITFMQNPEMLLNPGKFKGNLLSLAQKIEKIQNLGIQRLILIDFSEDFSKIAGREFIKSLLNSFKIVKMVIGDDFRFGYQRTIGKENIGKLIAPADLEIVSPVDLFSQKISSSRIREMIINGDFQNAEKLLGSPFRIDLRHVSQPDSFSAIRIQNAEIMQLLPNNGKYKVFLENGNINIPGLLSINDGFLEIRTVSDSYCKQIEFIRF